MVIISDKVVLSALLLSSQQEKKALEEDDNRGKSRLPTFGVCFFPVFEN